MNNLYDSIVIALVSVAIITTMLGFIQDNIIKEIKKSSVKTECYITMTDKKATLHRFKCPWSTK